jgi:hypothetical protein
MQYQSLILGQEEFRIFRKGLMTVEIYATLISVSLAFLLNPKVFLFFFLETLPLLNNVQK